MIKIKLATAYLTAMLAVAPSKDIRFYLNGIHLNVKNKKLEATDGFVALRIGYPLPEELTENIILPTVFIAKCAKVAKAAKQDFVMIEYNPEDGSLKTALHNSEVLHGQFPSLDRVFRYDYDYDNQPRCVDSQFINVFHNVMKPLVAVYDYKKRNKTPIAWRPQYGKLNDHRGCAVMQWEDVEFIAMELCFEAETSFSTNDILARLNQN